MQSGYQRLVDGIDAAEKIVFKGEEVVDVVCNGKCYSLRPEEPHQQRKPHQRWSDNESYIAYVLKDLGCNLPSLGQVSLIRKERSRRDCRSLLQKSELSIGVCSPRQMMKACVGLAGAGSE